MSDTKSYNLSVADDHIVFKGYSTMNVNGSKEIADEVIALAKEKHIDKILLDITEISTVGMGMEAQINAMGAFKEEAAVFRKVAFIVTNTFVRGLMATTLAAVKLYTHDKFRSFENEAEALAWLNEA